MTWVFQYNPGTKLPSKLAQVVTCIQEVLSSNVGQDKDCMTVPHTRMKHFFIGKTNSIQECGKAFQKQTVQYVHVIFWTN
jgi:hypothetical protein